MTQGEGHAKFLSTKITHALVFKKQFPLVDPGKFFNILGGKGFIYELRPVMKIDRQGQARRTDLGVASRDTGRVEYDPEQSRLTIVNETSAGLLPSQVETEEITDEQTRQGILYSIEDLTFVRDTLVKDLEIVLSKALSYLECVLETLIVGEKPPLVTLGQKGNIPIIDQLSAIFEEDVASFGFRIYPRSLLYTDANIRDIRNWYDLKVEPFITNPEQYSVRLVYRNENHEEYFTFIRRLDRIITNVIRLIEKE